LQAVAVEVTTQVAVAVLVDFVQLLALLAVAGL
jgi:hypothetical protein